jgi:hypothetical protein
VFIEDHGFSKNCTPAGALCFSASVYLGFTHRMAPAPQLLEPSLMPFLPVASQLG